MNYKIAILSLALFLSACHKDSDSPEEKIPIGKWDSYLINYPDILPRMGAVFFQHYGNAYVGGGSYQAFIDGYEAKNMYVFSRDTKFWRERDSMPGKERVYATTFVIGDSAYIGWGQTLANMDSPSINHNDFLIYNIATNKWSEEKIAFPGEWRQGAVAFSLNGKGYAGTGDIGRDNLKNDFYSYDPRKGWNRIAFPGDKRSEGVAFVIDGYAYVGLGYTTDGVQKKELSDLWKFNPQDESWTQVISNRGPGMARYAASCFVLYRNGKPYAYIAGGVANGKALSSCIEFDPRSNTWQEVAPLPEPVKHGIGFAISDSYANINPPHQAMLIVEPDMKGYVFTTESPVQ